MISESKFAIINKELFKLSRRTIIIISVTILEWICIVVVIVPLSSSQL